MRWTSASAASARRSTASRPSPPRSSSASSTRSPTPSPSPPRPSSRYIHIYYINIESIYRCTDMMYAPQASTSNEDSHLSLTLLGRSRRFRETRRPGFCPHTDHIPFSPFLLITGAAELRRGHGGRACAGQHQLLGVVRGQGRLPRLHQAHVGPHRLRTGTSSLFLLCL